VEAMQIIGMNMNVKIAVIYGEVKLNQIILKQNSELEAIK
jgi:hypothetical protein